MSQKKERKNEKKTLKEIALKERKKKEKRRKKERKKLKLLDVIEQVLCSITQYEERSFPKFGKNISTSL